MLASCEHWDIGVAKSKAEGKPPPESLEKIQRTGAGKHLESVANRKRTVLLTDGAKCYPPFAKKHKLLHEFVKHNKGEFVKTFWRKRQMLKCHTGTIDAAWKLCKSFIPNALSAMQNTRIFSCTAECGSGVTSFITKMWRKKL